MIPPPAGPTLEGVSTLVLDAALRWTIPLLVVWVASRLPALSAAVRHHLWASILAGLLLLPLVRPLIPTWQAPAVIAGMIAGKPAEIGDIRREPIPGGRAVLPTDDVVRADGLRTGTADGASSTAKRLAALRRAWPWVWLCGAMALLGYWLLGHAAALHLVRRSRPVLHSDQLDLLRDARKRLGVRRRICLKATAEAVVPVTWGLFRPAILLPQSSRDWTVHRLRGVLLHETAHIVRLDVLSHGLGRVACALFWFHPGVWLAARSMRLEAEVACDDRVVGAGVPAYDYAADLIRFAGSFRRAALGGATLPVSRRSGLEHRVHALLSHRRGRGMSRRSAVVLALTVAGLLAVAAGFRQSTGEDEREDWLREVALGGGFRGWTLDCGPADPTLCRDGTRWAMELLLQTGRGGAVVVQRVETGEIVAYASVAPAREEGGPIPLASPGSVAKLAIAALWWESGMGSQGRDCPGQLLLPSGRMVSNFGGRAHGTLAVPHDMLVASCNTAATGMALKLRDLHGAAAMGRALDAYGFGGHGLPARPWADIQFWAGSTTSVPPRWAAPPRPRFGTGPAPMGDDHVLAGLGLGGMETTPLHVSRFLQAVGNAGVLRAPQPGTGRAAPRPMRLLSEATAVRLQEAMRDVVRRGTASGVAPELASSRWALGGKTGTVLRPDGTMDGWFAGLIHAPGGAAEYTVVAFLRGGGLGGEVPAGIAAKLTRYYAHAAGDGA